MNLIEQLGEYENVSKHFNRIEYHAETKIFIGEWFGFYSMRDLKDALLEYRRQHNIFEVGDKVVSRCADKEIRIFTYQETIGKNILVKCKKGKGYCYPKKWFSHANDAEIKAGRRL